MQAPPLLFFVGFKKKIFFFLIEGKLLYRILFSACPSAPTSSRSSELDEEGVI